MCCRDVPLAHLVPSLLRVASDPLAKVAEYMNKAMGMVGVDSVVLIVWQVLSLFGS